MITEVYRFAVKIENLPFKDFLGYIGLSGEKLEKINKKTPKSPLPRMYFETHNDKTILNSFSSSFAYDCLNFLSFRFTVMHTVEFKPAYIKEQFVSTWHISWKFKAQILVITSLIDRHS